MKPHFSIQTRSRFDLSASAAVPLYGIFLFQGKARFTVDFVEHESEGSTVLFLSPYQAVEWLSQDEIELSHIHFHGDFYCIEYHREEVACNGVLFNDAYEIPFIPLADELFVELQLICRKLNAESQHSGSASESVVKSYLQLLLALCSREKLRFQKDHQARQPSAPEAAAFRDLLEHKFVGERSPAFYASQLGLSPGRFGKKIKHQFGKTPGTLIRERVILEAKRLLHLTHKSVKEIAVLLNFEDEFYFSRYFKKGVGIAPQHFRDQVGISKAAK